MDNYLPESIFIKKGSSDQGSDVKLPLIPKFKLAENKFTLGKFTMYNSRTGAVEAQWEEIIENELR